MTVTGTSGYANALAGDFGECWLEVVAAGCGLLHGRPTTLDFEKADVELILLGEFGDTRHPSVKVQVKTTHDLRIDDHGDFIYDLEVATYDELRRDNQSYRRILVVIKLSDGEERLTVDEFGTVLLGHGAWVSLEGAPPTLNATSVAVRLPRGNTLDAEGLHRMLAKFGVRRSSVVEEIDPWEGAPQ